MRDYKRDTADMCLSCLIIIIIIIIIIINSLYAAYLQLYTCNKPCF
jgi:hypothetical protein